MFFEIIYIRLVINLLGCQVICSLLARHSKLLFCPAVRGKEFNTSLLFVFRANIKSQTKQKKKNKTIEKMAKQ